MSPEVEIAPARIISRKEALAAGLSRYFTGKPCTTGHISERRVSCRSCVSCQKEKYQADPQKYIDRANAWRESNPGLYQANKGSWYQANRVACIQRAASWNKANPEKAKMITKANRAAKRASKYAAEGRYTWADILHIYTAQSGECKCCGVDTSDLYHVDHIVPLNLGGTNMPDNLQILCPTCNMQKGSKTMGEFRAYLGLTATTS